MIEVDLITGFLGSGKTTFIRKYLKYWSSQGKKIKVIENEFGAVSVDTKFLSGEECSLDDLSGCCMCCTGRDKFMNMLQTAADEGYDRILVEPSGIYDVDEFFDVMSQDFILKKCGIGSILTIVDACFDNTLSGESRYLMYAQLLAAGKVIFSKTQCHDTTTLEETKRDLHELIESFGSNGIELPMCEKSWEDFTDADFEAFAECGYNRYVHNRVRMDHGGVYETHMTGDFCEDQEDLKRRIDRLFSDASFGNIIRIKGFLRDLDMRYYEINCTHNDRVIVPCEVKRGLCVIIGQKLNYGLLKTEAFIPRTSVVVEK